MAASAAALKQETLFKTSIGGNFLTEVLLSINGEAEEYKAGGITVNLNELGLPDGIVECTIVKKFLDEKNEKAFEAQIVKGKLVLYAGGAEKKQLIELTEAEGKALKGYTCRVIAIGR